MGADLSWGCPGCFEPFSCILRSGESFLSPWLPVMLCGLFLLLFNEIQAKHENVSEYFHLLLYKALTTSGELFPAWTACFGLDYKIFTFFFAGWSSWLLVVCRLLEVGEVIHALTRKITEYLPTELISLGDSKGYLLP